MRQGSITDEKTKAWPIRAFQWFSADTLCLFQYPLSLTFFWYALCKFSDCAQSCQSHQLPMWKQPFVLCSDYRICLSLSSKPFILQTHIGVCCQLPLRAGQWPLWTRNIQESVINIPVTCANLWLFHLLRGAVSFLPRNLISFGFLNKPRKGRIQEERTSFPFSGTKGPASRFFLIGSRAAWMEFHQGLDWSEKSFQFTLLLFSVPLETVWCP